MKRIIILMAIVFAVASCNADKKAITANLSEKLKTTVKITDIKTLPVAEKFFLYTEEYNTPYGEYVAANKAADKHMSACDAAMRLMDIYSGSHYFSDRWDKAYKEATEELELSKKYIAEAEALENKADSISTLYEAGKLFVVEYKYKNKFDKWEPDYTIFAYNNDNTIHEFTGSENPVCEKFETLIFTAYPKLAKLTKEIISKYKLSDVAALAEAFM